MLQANALLWVHGHRLGRRDAEEACVKKLGMANESAKAHARLDHLAQTVGGCRGDRLLHVPPGERHLADHVEPVGQHLGQSIERVDVAREPDAAAGERVRGRAAVHDHAAQCRAGYLVLLLGELLEID
eukprot:scaffold36275_cov154-Isochrysis_galbana.AAC.13